MAAAIGVVAAAAGLGYGAFLMAYAASGREGSFYARVGTTPGLQALVQVMFVLPWFILLLAVIAVVLGAVAVRRRAAVGAGWVGVATGAVAPWLPIVGVIQVLMMSFAWM